VVEIWCAIISAKKGEALTAYKKGVLPFIMVLA
jgi:hypothetical protein